VVQQAYAASIRDSGGTFLMVAGTYDLQVMRLRRGNTSYANVNTASSKCFAIMESLTTDFDAQKTGVIVISCPVFIPVRYMQMVGRGLRGMKNGGTATCHVVTVLDNII